MEYEPKRLTDGEKRGAGEPVRPANNPGAGEPRRLTGGANGGIIKALGITYADVRKTDPKSTVSDDCIKVIIDTISKAKKQRERFSFDEVKVVNIPKKKDSDELIVFRTNATDSGGYPYVVLEINSAAFLKQTKDSMDLMILNAQNTVCDSLEDAVIHEIGHAKTIQDRTYANYKRIDEDLQSDVFTASKKKDEPSLQDLAKNISDTAAKDGLECIAECEVLLHRGETIDSRLKEMYDTYTTGGG